MNPPFFPPDVSYRSFSSGGMAKNSLASFVISATRPTSSPLLPSTAAAAAATTTYGRLRHHLLPTSLHGHCRSNLGSASTTAGRRGAASVRCMANQRRVKMVAKQIQRELSDMLLTDKVLQYAVLPEASLGADRYLSSLTTISDVEVSGDLQVVKVYVSVFGDERGREVAMAGLKSKAKYVRSELGRRMKLRLTPEIRFIEDESLERGSRVLAILDRLKEEKKTSEDLDFEESESANLAEEEEDGDTDDQDKDIIYVK